jgi:MFS transporter, PCFT/HCP family, solute carrier family 46 (folate transporter), member 1
MEESRKKYVKYSFGFEPCYLLIQFGFYLANAILQNQMLKQACLQSGYNITICTNLNEDDFTKDVEKEIQPKVADVNSAIVMLNSLFPPIYTLILGSWSDIYGRKKIMMMSFIGYSMTLALFTIFSFINDNSTTLTPWVYLIAEIPLCFMGSWGLLDIAACCYVTDISEKENHSIRLSTLTLINFTMNFCANISSSFILEATNTSIVFMISFCCVITGLILVIILVEESVIIQDGVNVSKQIKDIFSLSRIMNILKTITKAREMKRRRILWSLMAIVILAVFTMYGTGTVNYLFGREKFQWGLREFTIYDATNTAITAVGILVGLTTMKKVFKISDISLGFIALISAIVESLMKTFASETYQMYIASGLGVFKVLTTPVFRSMVSGLFPSTEIGKIYSSMGALEAFSGMGAGPLYSSVYKATFNDFSGAFHLITVAVFTISLIIATFVSRWMKKVEKYCENQEFIK